jgi:hypothetical protein
MNICYQYGNLASEYVRSNYLEFEVLATKVLFTPSSLLRHSIIRIVISFLHKKQEISFRFAILKFSQFRFCCLV